jgi:Xaa-Pro aminopeptidase
LTDPERPTLEFETLTLAPIDLALVETALMSPSEIDWLNRYHERVRTELGEGLSKAERAWLEAATRPLPTG